MSIKPYMPYEIANAASHIQQFWLKMIAEGQSERWATMCALQQPPGTKGTERAFFEGRNGGEWLDRMPKRQANYIIREAKSAGIDVAGKYYHSGIADRRGWCDPEAWVSSSDDVVRVAKKRRLEVRGAVNYTPPESEPPKRVGLAKDIVAGLAREEMKKNPALTKRQAAEIVKDRHTPRWAKGRKAGNK